MGADVGIAKLDNRQFSSRGRNRKKKKTHLIVS